MNRNFRLLQSYFRYFKEYQLFLKLNQNDNRFEVPKQQRMRCIRERTKETAFDRHYIYHTAWAARKLKELKPKIHVDIASSLYFCSIISSFMKVEFFDYRPPNLQLDNLSVGHVDIKKIHFADGSINSLSCMHVIEHIGLGRYGDEIDPSGDIKATAELTRVLEKNGTLLIVVPVGKKRIRFNAHRVYSNEALLNLFPQLALHEFTFIPDKEIHGHLLINPKAEDITEGCGCFLFKK